ncbi:hypothetical protein [Rodentibacter sp. Ppn85]|uniref:hypothetical protein n=1 Tax=Rodentibacter sp. Ppn85 TaxID=1908525 RepID=UPI000987269F|nr:hypothetical protein [Rodentibacter sp. Ppn85]OOF64705.1 hypothetical protein BKL51_06870 [Rodentibacter sp. Ppn85]
MLIEEWQAKRLYVNKSELENALGIKLDGVKTQKFTFKRELMVELRPYCSMAYFGEVESVALLLGLNPTKFNRHKHDSYYPIYRALKSAIETGELKNSDVLYPESIDESLSIGHVELEKWAKHYGYKWELPPYNPMISSIDENHPKSDQGKDRNVEELQAKITELENQLQAQQSAANSQEVLPVSNLDENYNPTERETHLLMIDAMAKLLTNQNFNVNKYIRGKNINKKQISEDVTEHITEVLNTPETKSRSLETIRKRLDEALKLNEQAD